MKPKICETTQDCYMILMDNEVMIFSSSSWTMPECEATIYYMVVQASYVYMDKCE
jgi:hypothetical protein